MGPPMEIVDQQSLLISVEGIACAGLMQAAWGFCRCGFLVYSNPLGQRIDIVDQQSLLIGADGIA